MALTSINISKYRVYLFDRITNYNNRELRLLAEIIGYDANAKGIFILTFAENKSNKEFVSYINNKEFYRVFPRIESYPWFLDLLRNESPIVFRVDPGNLEKWDIKSARENVGEDDLE